MFTAPESKFKGTFDSLGIVVATAGVQPMVAITDSAGAKVKVVLDGWEAAWNASDMTAMWRLATDDVHWVNVVGMHWRGKAEVQKAHQVYFRSHV